MPVKRSFKGSLDLNFFESPEFESTNGCSEHQRTAIMARNALRLLLMGWSKSWKELLSWDSFKAIFIQRNREALREMRLAFQQGFEHLYCQLHDKDYTEEQLEQIQLYLSNCLSVLPYTDLTPYESIKIPQRIDKEWVLLEYHVEPIELTHRNGIMKRFFLQDQDRVFAYGLEAMNHPKAESHLIFMGTTYPAGQGFVPQVSTDLKGFETVGKTLYISGRKNLKNWLVKQEKTHVCGVSLGGSLSLLLAIDQGDLISRVDALNPAGLHDHWFTKSRYDQWDEQKHQPQVVVQQQDRDPVSPFGVWKKEWDILRVVPPKNKQGPHAVVDHILNYAGFIGTEFTYVDPEKINSNNAPINIGLYSIARGLFYYSIVVPFNYLVRPALNFILNNKLAVTLLLMGVATLITLSSLGIVPMLVASVGSVSLFGLLMIAKATSYFFFVRNQRQLDETAEYAELHDPRLPRNPSMDIYNSKNETEVTLTYKEINSYYHAMRCLVKGKEFIPAPDDSKKMIKGISKRELLLASTDPDKADYNIQIKTTKAKAYHIAHTLSLLQQLGTENKAQLKSELQSSYVHYSMGKHLKSKSQQ